MSLDDLSCGFREASALLDIEESRLRYWAQTGLVTPGGQRGTRHYYRFEDLITLRLAHELQQLGVAPAQTRQALQELRDALPPEHATLHRLRVAWSGSRVTVADDSTASPPDGEGKLLFRTWEIRSRIQEAASTEGAAEPSAYHHFLRGCRLDEQAGQEAEAEGAYRRALDLDPALGSAWTNLGNLLHRRGDAEGARRCYERAIELEPEQAEARYNLANLFDQAGESEMAIAEYERTLRAAPDFADAHHNLALTLDRIGAKERSLAHWTRYRELVADGDLAG